MIRLAVFLFEKQSEICIHLVFAIIVHVHHTALEVVEFGFAWDLAGFLLKEQPVVGLHFLLKEQLALFLGPDDLHELVQEVFGEIGQSLLHFLKAFAVVVQIVVQVGQEQNRVLQLFSSVIERAVFRT